ncbi:MAG: hypothetical protein E6R03_16160 [Hyphomicrobiaceae bacterium]|nr:MAG: hypothetical protein E6R03_16160 [Hyphomicrobiaceae bacterium]
MSNYTLFSNLSETMKESVLSAVQQVTACSTSKVFILWDEMLLTLVNPPKRILKEFTYMTKSMGVDNRGRRKSLRTKEECFEASLENGILVVRTLHGFWYKAMYWCMENRLTFELRDLRVKDMLPPPRFDLMCNFRFRQRELLEKALLKNCSGLIGAPTRYGKSTLMRNILRAWPTTQTIVILPGADLLRQCHEELKAEIPDREIKLIGAGSKTQYQSEDITVVSMDSLHKVDPGPVKLMVIDEPHAVVASSRINYLPLFTNARRYGLGATLNGRYDGRDFLLEGHVGPVLAKRTYTEGVAEGAICPIKVMMIRWPIANISGDRDNAYRTQLFENELIGRCARYLSDVVIPRDWQMLYFIKTESQADFLSDCIGRDVSVAMAKKLSDRERKAMTERVRKNHIKRVICSDIYVQGVTFHEVMVLVNCGGGGASTSTIQKPGRLAEIRKGKSAGLMIDFLFTTQNEGMPNCDAEALSPGKMRGMSEGVGCLVRESYLRLKAYHDIGYDVDIVERKNMHDWFLKQNITPPD